MAKRIDEIRQKVETEGEVFGTDAQPRFLRVAQAQAAVQVGM